MKKTLRLTTTLLFLFGAQGLRAQLVNGNFETWTNVGGFDTPVGWYTNNGIALHPTIVKGVGYTGQWSAKFVTDSTGPGQYIGGNLDIPFSGAIRPTTLTGFWRGTIVGVTDEVAADMYVYDAGSNPIGYGSEYIYTSIANWTAFSMTINYTSSVAAANSGLDISLFSTDPLDEAYIDDLTMTYTTGTNDLVEAHFPSAQVFPDFASGNQRLYIDLLSKSSVDIHVFSENGQVVFSKQMENISGHTEMMIPASGFAPGIYFCTVQGTDFRKTCKFSR